jgi:hypothetical protein
MGNQNHKFYVNFIVSYTNSHFVEKNLCLNMLCKLLTLFDHMDLINASFSLFCWKLMLTMGTSCIIQKSGG